MISTDTTEFLYYMTCSQEGVTIDFDREFILVGFTRYHSGIGVTDQDVILRSDTLFYRVELGDGLIAIPTAVTYIVKLSREYLQYTICFDVDRYKHSL